MKRVAIVGYGNIGKMLVDAVRASGDMELAGIVRRNAANKIAELPDVEVVDDVDKLGKVDVAILSIPSRSAKDYAKTLLEKGINTVDSFDIHSDIYDNVSYLDEVAKKSGAVSIISAGWDPGTDSVVRTLLRACAPAGITYTDFGPGMSMGHSVVAKKIDGVKDAMSSTIPLGTGIHRRMVYVELDGTVDFATVENAIKTDSYFASDETHVIEVDDVAKVKDVGHGVNISRKGVSGKTGNQRFNFEMRINNPALTAQVMCSCARATFKQEKGAYTLIEIPVIDLLEGDREQLIRELV